MVYLNATAVELGNPTPGNPLFQLCTSITEDPRFAGRIFLHITPESAIESTSSSDLADGPDSGSLSDSVTASEVKSRGSSLDLLGLHKQPTDMQTIQDWQLHAWQSTFKDVVTVVSPKGWKVEEGWKRLGPAVKDWLSKLHPQCSMERLLFHD